MREVGGCSYLHERAVFRCGQRGTVFTGCRGTLRGDKIALVQQFDNNGVLTLGTLGSLVAIQAAGKNDGSRNMGFRYTKSTVWFTMQGGTTNEGPIMIGVACNCSAAELEAAMENDAQDQNDPPNRSGGMFIKPLFIIGEDELKIPLDSAPGPDKMFTFSYGKNGWSVQEKEQWTVWAYNMDSGALTTGTVIKFFAEHFGVWLRD